MKGYLGVSKPTPYPTKQILARQWRATVKKTSQVANPPKLQGTSPMGIQTVVSNEARVPREDQTEQRCECEAPLDPRMTKDEKRGTSVKDLVSVSI